MQAIERLFNHFPERYYLERDPTAVTAHQAGLRAALAYQHETALSHYDQAVDMLDNADDPGLADVITQRATVLRDRAFTYTREGSRSRDPEHFLLARTALWDVAETLGDLAVTPYTIRFARPGRHNTPKRQRRTIFSELGATHELLARTASAEEKIIGPSPETAAAKLHGTAHDILRLGPNGYYRVSNDINNTRQERSEDSERLPHTVVALLRTTRSLGWTAVHDPRNFPAAAGSVIRRLPALSSSEAAAASIVAHP